jgi:hypothetical protein
MPVSQITATASGPALDRPTEGVAIGLLAVFVLIIAVNDVLRGDADWDRMVFVFNGLEAIVFAGAGALFGTTVQRGAVSAARAEAVQARDVAAAARQEAKSSTEEAARDKALAAMNKALGNGEVPTDSNRLGARADDNLRPEPSLAGRASETAAAGRLTARVM